MKATPGPASSCPSYRSQSNPPLQSATRPAGSAGRPFVIVVSNATVREQISRSIRRELGLVVKTFTSCTDAMLALDANAIPSGLLFDVVMPDGNDGNDLLRWRNQNFPGVPAIAMTYVNSALREPGASAVLRKPFLPDELVSTLGRVLALGVSTLQV